MTSFVGSAPLWRSLVTVAGVRGLAVHVQLLPAVDPQVDAQPDAGADGRTARRRELAGAADAAVRGALLPAPPEPRPPAPLVMSGGRRVIPDVTAFAREFLRDPLHTASVTPSSAVLGATATSPVPLRGSPVVIELGAGTGTISDVIRRRLGGRGQQLAIEVNPRLADRLAVRCPEIEVHCVDAAELPAVLSDRRLVADVIVSGLPWAAFAGDEPPALLERLAGCLPDDGVLTQLGYAATRWAPPARRQLAALHRNFEEVTTSRTIWRNLPPAVIHIARRPRRTGPAG